MTFIPRANRVQRALFVAAIAAALVPVAAQEDKYLRRPTPQVTVNVGIEGRLLYRFEGELRPRPFSPKSPVVVRIASTSADGGAVLYDLRFIGVQPGLFELRDALERPDGGSLGAAPAAVVAIASILPEDHDGQLIAARGLGLPRFGGYRLALIAAGVAWTVPLAWLVIKRLTHRKPVVQPAGSAAPPSLADQLRPLVEAAIAGRAGPDDLAKLERLLIAHWGDRLMLGDLPMNEALSRVKSHEQAGEILRRVEAWLHRPRGVQDQPPDLSAMLAPYRGGQRSEPASHAPSAVAHEPTSSAAAAVGGAT